MRLHKINVTLQFELSVKEFIQMQMFHFQTSLFMFSFSENSDLV